MDKKKFIFNPTNYAVHPGVILKDELAARGMTQDELALRTGFHKKHISEIINGKSSITHEASLKFEVALGVSSDFWNSLQSNFNEYLARQAQQAEISNNIAFLKKIPVNEMIKRKWIPDIKDKVEQLKSVFNFLGFTNIDGFEKYKKKTCANFRTDYTHAKDPNQLAVWLRKGEIDAASMELCEYNKKKLEENLPKLRELTKEKKVEIFLPKVRDLLAESGIAFTVVEEFNKTNISGAAKWIVTNKKALIILSFRGKTNDRFWFNLFHEIGHIYLNHSPKQVYINYINRTPETSSAEENAADKFASDILIHPSSWNKFKATGDFTEDAIISFSKSIDVHPAIVLGRLQKKDM